MTTGADGDGRATLRDVYQSQKETRQEISDLRDEVVGKVDGLTDAVHEMALIQERRVTKLETVQDEHTAVLADHEARIGVIEKARDRALGHLGAWKILGGIGAAASSLILADVVAHWIGG